jgi:hypothetical protein
LDRGGAAFHSAFAAWQKCGAALQFAVAISAVMCFARSSRMVCAAAIEEPEDLQRLED